MKKIIILSIFICISNKNIFAQAKQISAVESKIEQLKKAMIDADTLTLMNITSNQLSYGHSGGHVDTKEEFIKKIATGSSNFETMDFEEQTITIFDKTAIVRHKLNGKTNDNNKPGEVHLKVMLVFQKVKKEWILIARQAVKI